MPSLDPDASGALDATCGRKLAVKVDLRNPARTVEFDGGMSVARLLNKLNLNRETVLVICDGTLVPHDATLDAGAHVEIRNVISGGAK